MIDPDDTLSPADLVAAARGHLQAALAQLDHLQRALQGAPPPREEPANIVHLSARKNRRRVSPSPGGRGGDGRGGQGVRGR